MHPTINRFKNKAFGAFSRKKQQSVLDKKRFLDALNNVNLNEQLKLELLHAACRYDRIDVVEKLVTVDSIDLNGLDEDGQTPILIAVENTSIDCYNFLLTSGADLEHLDKAGRSVLIVAMATNNYNIVNKLIKKGNLSKEIIQKALAYVIETKNSEALAILADYDEIELKEFSGDISFLDKKQYSPLHYAAKRGFARSVSKLIYAGSKLCFRNMKDSPVGLAYSYNQYEVFSHLLSAGCVPDIEMKPTAVPYKWFVIVKRISNYESINGNDVQELLQYLKMLQTNDDSAEIHIICQHFQTQLELLDFFPLRNIVSVTIINCVLTHIPVFPNVLRLCLNRCTVLDYANLVRYENVQMLSLCNNDLNEIPTVVKDLKNLTYLDISHNKQMAMIPLWIMGIPLCVLSVHDNGIIELPELLPKSLQVLDIHNNFIQRLSPLLAKLPDLSYISLNGNPLVFPETSITKSKTKALLQYLHAFLIDTIQNDTVKVSLVGQERVGKSTLAEALKSSTGICEDVLSIIKTDGLEISDINLQNFKLRIFDLAGDIDFIETHTMFISEGTLYLAVFDLRSYSIRSHSNFLGRIEVWLSSIHAQAPQSRVILVGTHADGEMITVSLLDSVWQHIKSILQNAAKKHKQDFANNHLKDCLLCNHSKTRERQSFDGLAGYVIADTTNEDTDSNINEIDVSSNSKFNSPHILGYYEVSNIRQIPKRLFGSKNLSIEQLKDGIHKACGDILSMSPTIPRKWINLHNILHNQVEKHFPIIRYQAFAEYATKCGFENTDEELSPFLRHYHSCGELLYYFEIDELCDIIITDPQWLSNQLRTVVSYRNIPNLNEGVINHSELGKIWCYLEVEYQKKLLSLFRQAGVFIQFNEDSELIPCRLPIGRPSEDIWSRYPKETECQVDYYFQFDNLPPSFFSHLISLIETKGQNFTGMMQPLYHSNHIVYITKSDGIPCDIHTKQIPTITLQHGDTSSNEMLTDGLNLARFLSLDPTSVESLLDIGRNSFQVTLSNDVDMDIVDFKPAVKSNRHRIHFELFPHKKAITVSIRGFHPCCLAPETIDLLNRVRLTRYEGVNGLFYVMCPVCVRKSYHDAEKFSLLDMEEHEPVCKKGHDLISWNSVMTGQCDYVATLTAENIITNLTESECPKLFVMIPVNLQSVGLREFYTLTYLKEGYAIHLLCEYPDCWHFLSSPGYRLTRPKDFVKRYGRRLQTMLRVLSKLEVPARFAATVFEPLSNLADCCEKMGQFATDLDSHLNDFQDDWNFVSGNHTDDDLKYLKSSEGLQRREFRRFLNKADEENRFGHLIPSFFGDDIIWLCEEHYNLHKVV